MHKPNSLGGELVIQLRHTLTSVMDKARKSADLVGPVEWSIKQISQNHIHITGWVTKVMSADEAISVIAAYANEWGVTAEVSNDDWGTGPKVIAEIDFQGITGLIYANLDDEVSR